MVRYVYRGGSTYRILYSIKGELTMKNKTSKKTRFLSLLLSILSLILCMILLASPIAAAYSAIEINVAPTPNKGNRTKYALPPTGPATQGDTFYLNLSATEDWYLDFAEFYVREPGQTSYTCVYKYDPSGYFRWVNCPYTFEHAGIYEFTICIKTTSGAQGSAGISIDVAAKNSNNSDSSNTYTYDNEIFNVVSNFDTKYCFNQNDYSRFVNSSGSNRGCTATAMCIAYSIYRNETLNPNDVLWSSGGTSWEYCERYSDGNKTYVGGEFKQSEALKAAYNCVTNDNKPMIIGVYGAGCDHVVTIIGVSQNADYSDLSLGDFLIVDPWGGTVETLDTYTSIDCGWGLRIPIDE